MRYFLGIDFGGGASKATLLSENGTIEATATYEYPTDYKDGGRVEQNPDDWFEAIKENIHAILAKSKVSPADITAVALDAATHTAVIMDEKFNVLRPSIYWTDTRSVNEVKYLKENYSSVISKQVFHEPDTIWTLSELLWIKNNEPHIWEKVRRIMFAKDYVRHILTGDYVTDYIEAEGSMMFDAEKQEWSKELCGVLGIDTKIMPKITQPTSIVGYVTAYASKITGLYEGTAVICGTTDTAMEVFAAGAVKKGQMTLKLATAGRICVITDKIYSNKHLINYSHIVPGLYYPGTATKACAASYRWFRDTFGDDYKKLDFLAENVPIGSQGLIFHPYLNGELTPYANPNLCADFVGVRALHNKGHFARAVLEGVAMSMLDCKTTLDEIGIEHGDEAVIIGGGGQSVLWRQIVSDALGIKFVQKKFSDSSFGSAMMAGVAKGAFGSFEEAVAVCNKDISITYPNSKNTELYADVFKKYKAVQKALEKIYDGEY